MGTMTDNRSVAANATTGNILAGKTLEFVAGAPAAIRFYPVAAAVGMNATIIVGGEIVVDDQEISSANRFPNRDEDMLAAIGGLPGERILVNLRNTTVAAIVVITLVDVTPIA